MKTFKPPKIVTLGKLAFAVLTLLIIFQQILQLKYVINTKIYLPDRENDPSNQKQLNLYNFDIETGSSVDRNSLKYLVNTESCKLQDLNPFDPLQMKHFKLNLKEPNCINSQSPMELVNNQLKLTDDVRDSLSNQSKSANRVYLKCCFKEISRVQPNSENSAIYDEKAEWTANISKCYVIEDSLKGIITTAEFVITSCVYHLEANHKKYGNRERTYLAQVHPPENHSAQTKAKTNIWKEKFKAVTPSNSASKPKSTADLNNDFHPPNVLIIGIDATSRLHSMRSIPKTREFLEQNDFIEMKGYTKVGDNTFPNVMAFLTGMEVEQKSYPFWPNISVTVDDFPFIWKNFSANQYITAFIEDYIEQSMFGFGKLGFVQQPTDYYTRPLLNHFEFHGRINHHPYRCISGKTEANFVLDYIQSFIKRMNSRVDLSSNLATSTTNNETTEKRNKSSTLTYPYFLTSWLGSIGHDDFNGLRQTDGDFYKFFADILPSTNPTSDQYNNNNHKVSDENTVIVLLGDHGYRFDVGRDTASGYFENSLPMFFIRIPPGLKSARPQWYSNLVVNSNRLTTPLDLHKTLENIVSMSNPTTITSTRKPQASDENEEADKDKDNNNNVYSLFEEIPQNRSCKSARIPKTYCRCNIQAYDENINVKVLSPRYGEALAGWINALLRSRGLSDICLPVSFDTYEYVRQLYFTEENEKIIKENDDESKKPIFSNSPSKYFLIGAYILPGTGLFEATIKIRSEFSNKIEFVGNVSRINSYGRYKGEYSCVDKSEDRAYCACQRQPQHQLLDFAFR